MGDDDIEGGGTEEAAEETASRLVRPPKPYLVIMPQLTTSSNTQHPSALCLLFGTHLVLAAVFMLFTATGIISPWRSPYASILHPHSLATQTVRRGSGLAKNRVFRGRNGR